MANASRLEGAVADRVVSVGGLVEYMVDKAGADELGWVKMVFSGDGARTVAKSGSLGVSGDDPLVSNDRGGSIGEGLAV